MILQRMTESDAATERGAVFVEAVFALGVLAVVFMSFMAYFNKYLGKDEELLAKQLLSIGRLNVVPPLLTRSEGGCTISKNITSRISLFLRESFVTRDVAVSGGSCVAQADIRAFYVRFNAENPNGKILGDPTNAGLGGKGQIFKCDGTYVATDAPAAETGAALAIVPKVKIRFETSADDDKTYLVVYSNLYTDFKPQINPADVSGCMDPVGTPSSPP